MESTHISQGLISQHDIQNNLITIFPDSLILSNNMMVVAVSNRLASLFGYEPVELVGKSFQQFSERGGPLTKSLKNELSKKGFFDKFLVELKAKQNNSLQCYISGFYLGLISDINGFAILKITLIDEAHLLSKELETSRLELDEFVYRTAHDLRGPLATVKGLINLLKMEEITEGTKNIISLLDSQTQTMDDRLFNLNYLSVMSNEKTANVTLDCSELESILRSTIEENMGIDSLDFQFKTCQHAFKGVNAQLIISMLNHFLLYLINLPRNSNTQLLYSIDKVTPGIQVTIYAEGFLCNYQLRQAMQRKDPLYTTIITYADLINFFAAMKTSERIRATTSVDFIHETRQQISVIIPLPLERKVG
jgi:hypothetical protein